MTIKDLTEHLLLSPHEKASSTEKTMGYWHYDDKTKSFELSEDLKHTFHISDDKPSWMTLIHEDDLDDLRLKFNYAINENKPFSARLRLRHKQSIIWVSIQSRIDSQDDVFLGFYGSIYDITHEIFTELEDESKIKSLENIISSLTQEKDQILYQSDKQNAFKSSFLSTMSHELRTPMNAMMGFLKLLDETDLNDVQKEYVSRLHDASTHLLSMMNNILDLSKMEAGKMVLEKNRFKMDKLISDVKTLLEKNAEMKHLYLDIETINCPPSLIGDSLRIKQILINLINNAIKFTDMGGISLVISSEMMDETHHMVSFKVSDTGIGMTAEQQSRLFREFEQADLSTTRHYGGTGLGLSISKKLADLMQGEITVQSKLNEGTTFTLLIPLLLDDDIEDDQEEEHQIAPTFKPQAHILVAEDHILSQKLTEHMLTQLDVHVKIVENGEKAIQAMKDDAYDLVFLDMNMPVIDGIKAAKAIRRFNAKTPLIALTANQYAEDRSRCLLAGMNDILVKPIDKNMLIDMLSKWLPE